MQIKNLIRSTAKFALSSYAFQAVNFGVTLLLVRLVSPDLFGIFAVMMAIKEIFSIIFGFSTSQYYVLSEGKDSDFHKSFTLSAFSAFLLLCFGGVIFVILQSTAYKYLATPLLILFIVQGLDNIASIFLAPIEKKTDYLQLSLIKNSGTSLSLILATILALFHTSIWILILREILIVFIVLSLGMIFYKRPVKFEFGISILLSIARFNYKISFSRLAEVFFYRIPELLISKFFGVTQTGNFTQSRNFLMIFLKLPNTILDETLLSTFVALKDTKLDSSRFIFVSELVLCRIMLIGSLLIFYFGKPSFIFLYGDMWVKAGELIPNLSWFVFFAALFNFEQSLCYSQRIVIPVIVAYICGIITLLVSIFCSLFYFDFAFFILSISVAMGFCWLFLRIYGHLKKSRNHTYQIFWLPAFCLLSFFIPNQIADEKLLIFRASFIGLVSFVSFVEFWIIMKSLHKKHPFREIE